jgi:hypothetical protein
MCTATKAWVGLIAQVAQEAEGGELAYRPQQILEMAEPVVTMQLPRLSELVRALAEEEVKEMEGLALDLGLLAQMAIVL